MVKQQVSRMAVVLKPLAGATALAAVLQVAPALAGAPGQPQMQQPPLDTKPPSAQQQGTPAQEKPQAQQAQPQQSPSQKPVQQQQPNQPKPVQQQKQVQQQQQQQKPVQQPNPQQQKPSQQSPSPAQQRPNASAQGERYTFDQQHRQLVRNHYQRVLGKVDRRNRPQFVQGAVVPGQYRQALTRAPQSLLRRLPAPPAGYAIGYYQGYTLVYNPTTFVILSVLDLLTD